MTTIFTQIINREIPSHFIYEDDHCVAIMDKFPAVPGQSLVILKREVDYLFDISDRDYGHLMKVAKQIALASDQAFAAARTCLVVEGFEVPHVHIKLYPIKEVTDGTSLNSLTSDFEEADDTTLAEQAAAIKAAL